LVLPRSFYARDTVAVARDLLGQVLVHGNRSCRIVETEAYVGPFDLACHASRGRTPRTEVMFGRPGHAYVYLIYGMYHLLNLVTESEGFPAAVLIRAGEPNAKGPGLLCRELAITREQHGADITTAGPLRVELGGAPNEEIVTTTRIGISYAGEWANKPLRFYLKGNPWVSRRLKGEPLAQIPEIGVQTPVVRALSRRRGSE
jgi:DNA-3-methyladenine glycosylase